MKQHVCAPLLITGPALACTPRGLLQVAAAEAFSAIMRGCFMSAADVSNCMLPLILANVQRESPEEVRGAATHA